MLRWRRPVSFVNARVALGDGEASSLRVGSRILSIDERPRAGDLVVDLDGACVLPGLINAHDHLELNHYGPLKRRDSYQNASTWIDDLRPELQHDAVIRRNGAYPLAARLFIGGLKNILAGVTTVAHHNPFYRELGRWFPVRVVRRYGWAHSFMLERQPVGAHGEPGGDVRERCLATPADVPFVVHASEGTDEAAGAELKRLEALGCLRSNTVMVHGVSWSATDWARVVGSGSSLVWCPASNVFLFGRTAAVPEFIKSGRDAASHICLGSDSRVTGARDLLDEIRVARSAAATGAEALLRLVTTAPARILRLRDGGRIAVGAPADLLIVPPAGHGPAEALLDASRRDVLLVTIAGRPAISAPVFRPVFGARRTAAGSILVDGVEKFAASRLARAIARCPISEPGVQCLS
jgi:cytosine/adenosine deaminase-related metal-dependent hydrolase